MRSPDYRREMQPRRTSFQQKGVEKKEEGFLAGPGGGTCDS